MKVKYYFVIGFIISIISLSISLVVLFKEFSKSDVPSGVKEICIVKGEDLKIKLDSITYIFALGFFRPYCESCSLEVRKIYEGSITTQRRTIRIEERIRFFDFYVILKESYEDSVRVWIEKIGG